MQVVAFGHRRRRFDFSRRRNRRGRNVFVASRRAVAGVRADVYNGLVRRRLVRAAAAARPAHRHLVDRRPTNPRSTAPHDDADDDDDDDN